MKRTILVIAGAALLLGLGACAKKQGGKPIPKLPVDSRQNPTDPNSSIKPYKSREVLFNLYPAPEVVAAMKEGGIDSNTIKMQFVQYYFMNGDFLEVVEISVGSPTDTEPAPFEKVVMMLDFPLNGGVKGGFTLRYKEDQLSQYDIGVFTVTGKSNPTVESLCTIQPGGEDYSQTCHFSSKDGIPQILMYE